MNEELEKETQEIQEKQVGLNEVVEKKPLGKMKVGIVFVLIVFFLLLILYSIISAFSNTKKIHSTNEVVELESPPTKSSDNVKNQINSQTSYNKFDSTLPADLKKEKTKLIPANEKNTNTVTVLETKNTNYNVAFKQQQISEEITSRHSSITFSNNSNKDTGKSANNDKNQTKNQIANSLNSRNIYNSKTLESPLSKYQVSTGNVIRGVMITGINSELQGTMIGQVLTNIYDSVTGNYLLIPRGTKIIGTYNSQLLFGQSRLLVVWQRLQFPNGEYIELDNFEGADLQGYAGMTGKVNNHTAKLLQSVVLSSVLGAATAITTNNTNDSDNTSWQTAAGEGAGQQMISIGTNMANRILSQSPTIEIKPGEMFNIMVNSDLILKPYNDSRGR